MKNDSTAPRQVSVDNEIKSIFFSLSDPYFAAVPMSFPGHGVTMATMLEGLVNLRKFSTISAIAIFLFAESAVACGGGATAGAHATNPPQQTLNQLRGNLRAIKNNHATEKSAAKAINKLRVAIAKRSSDCRREAKAAHQLRAARERGASGFNAGYIPRKLCT